MSSESPISVEELDEIICGDSEFLRLLTDQFWAELEHRLPELRAAVSTFDGPAVANLAHTIAGSAGCVAAQRLRDKAKALEACGLARHSGEAARLLQNLEDEVQLVRAFLDNYQMT